MKSSKKVLKKISIEFDKKQFFALMKAVYLGNWMANAWRVEEKVKDYEDIENYIFSLAPKFGLDKYMNHEESDGDSYYPTAYFEDKTDVHVLHEEYDEETFWEELAHRMGDRNFFQEYGLEKIKAMSRDERFVKNYEFIDKINEELDEFGLERFQII